MRPLLICLIDHAIDGLTSLRDWLTGHGWRRRAE